MRPDRSSSVAIEWLRNRWAYKHRPILARFVPFKVWQRTVRFKSRWVPWSYAYRYRVTRGWHRGWLG